MFYGTDHFLVNNFKTFGDRSVFYSYCSLKFYKTLYVFLSFKKEFLYVFDVLVYLCQHSKESRELSGLLIYVIMLYVVVQSRMWLLHHLGTAFFCFYSGKNTDSSDKNIIFERES